MKYAIYGGSFNPIHIGHTLAISYLLQQGFDKIFVVPCGEHPYGKDLIDFFQRYEMINKVIANSFPIDKVFVSNIEYYLPKPNFTYQTVEKLYEEICPKYDDEIRLILGTDLLEDFHRWKGSPLIKKMAPPFFIGRSGWEKETTHPTILPDISSTKIRKLLKTDPGSKELEFLMPKNVLDYIFFYKLYY